MSVSSASVVVVGVNGILDTEVENYECETLDSRIKTTLFKTCSTTKKLSFKMY